MTIEWNTWVSLWMKVRHLGTISHQRVRIPYRIWFCVVTNSVTLNMYKTLIYPLLTYCNIVWGGGSAGTYLNKLLNFHEKIIRIINNSNYSEHSEPLFRQTAIYSEISRLVWLSVFALRFSLSSHSHETRNSATYLIPNFQRLAFAQRSLNYVLPSLIQ